MEIHPYSQSNIDLKEYKKGPKLKKGGFGSVYLVQEIKSGNSYAAKVVDCNDNKEQCKKLIDREVGIMMLMNHPTIIKFIGFSFQDFQKENNVTLIMELAEEGSLADVIQKVQQSNGPKDYTNTSRQIILIGVARGMKYLHDRNIIHRDLKPSNILLDKEFNPHITDFGLSKFYEVNHSKSQSKTCGTLSYMSPEIIRGRVYDTKTDVYSFAILMFEVLTDLPPYPDLENGRLSDYDFQNKVVNDYYRPKFEFPIDEKLKQLIEECWSPDPKDRPTFDEIFDKLTDPEYFIQDVDQSDVDLYIKDVTEIDDPFEAMIHQNQNLKKENILLKNDINKLGEIKKDNEILTIDNNELKKINDTLKNDNNELREENCALKNENNELKNKNNSLTSENIELQNENKNLNIFNGELLKFNEILKNENQQFKKDIEKHNKIEPIIINFMKNNYFIEYINLQEIEPVIEIDDALLNQIKSLSKQNPAILGFNNDEDSQIIIQNYGMIVSQYKIKGTLKQLHHILDLESKYYIMIGIAFGLHFLHSKNIIYGNLRPETILINDSNLSYICDFGLKPFFNEINLNPIFIAPEYFESKEIELKSDVYSFSMIVYLLVTDQYPSIECSQWMVATNIIKGKRPDISMINNRHIKAFLQKCWSKKLKDRPTFSQIIEMMTDSNFYSFFEVDIEKLYRYIRIFDFDARSLLRLDTTQIPNHERNYKIVCLGNSFTGKSCLIYNFTKKKYNPNLGATVGCAFYMYVHETKHGKTTLEIWDTSGDHKIQSYSRFFPESDAILLFIDVSIPHEYLELQRFLDEISDLRDNKPLLYLILTKNDLEWKNTKKEYQDFAKNHKMKLFETSNYDLQSIEIMFESIIEDLNEEFPFGKLNSIASC